MIATIFWKAMTFVAEALALPWRISKKEASPLTPGRRVPIVMPMPVHSPLAGS